MTLPGPGNLGGPPSAQFMYAKERLAHARRFTLTDTSVASAVPESDLDMVKRHVRNAELRVAAQRKLIALIAARRLPLKQALELLHLYEVTLQAHVDHLAHIEDITRRRALPRRSGERVGRRSR
jgi:hypothetical protein